MVSLARSTLAMISASTPDAPLRESGDDAREDEQKSDQVVPDRFRFVLRIDEAPIFLLFGYHVRHAALEDLAEARIRVQLARQLIRHSFCDALVRLLFLRQRPRDKRLKIDTVLFRHAFPSTSSLRSTFWRILNFLRRRGFQRRFALHHQLVR